MLTEEIPIIPPHQFALEFFKDLERSTNQELENLAKRSFVHLLIDLHPGIQSTTPSDAASTYYEIDPSLASHFAVFANGNYDIAQVIVHICCANVWNGLPVPAPFRAACTQIMRGKKPWPTPSGRKPGERFGLFWLATGATKMICDAYGIDDVARGDDKPDSPCDAVADALTEMDVECRYTKVRDWCQHGKHKINRTKAAVLSRLLEEHALRELGLIKTPSLVVNGMPDEYGPITVLGRMTR